MSKGKDFRGPKKRGFDDDGPSPYDAPRSSRHSSRPAFGGGFGGGPEMAPPVTGTPVDAVVKWFKGDKGFGFVVADDGAKDVFVHISVLERSGLTGLAEGQRVNMRVVETQKGR